jgi:nucleoside-diphosphate-sugar epimerase
VLGRLIAREWRSIHGSNAVVRGVVRQADAERKAELEADGMIPCLRAELGSADAGLAEGSFQHVVFCAAPGGNDDYPAEVAAALRMWSGQQGRFVFTSSAGVFAEENGGVVTEGSAVSDSPRAAKLLAAERLVTEAGGAVVRLAGLYLLERGAHNAYLNTTEVKGRADGFINQIHYEDAASAAVAALLRGAAGEIYLAADDAPLTREQICRAALLAPPFRGRTVPTFASFDGADKGGAGTGKIVDTSRTRAALGWKPKYATFAAFMQAATP